MGRGVDRLVALGYFVILGLLSGFISLCFIWGILEYRKPTDPGPLFIDLDRTIDERSEAQALRRSLEAILKEKGLSLVRRRAKPRWLKPSKAHAKVSVVEGKIKEIWSVEGSLSVPDGARLDRVLVVNGDLKTGNGCAFDEDVYVIGNAVIGIRNRLRAITARGDLTIGGGTTVKGFADSDGELRIGSGSSISGGATSASMIKVGSRCRLKKIYSPMGYRAGKAAGSRPPARSRKASKELSEFVLWNPRMDKLIKERFGEVSVDDLSMEIKDCLGAHVPAKMILRRARMLGLVEKALTKLNKGQKPKYLESATVWVQEAETIRVRGDVRIPRGEAVPYNMIVEGNLTSEGDVTFQGGLHVKGRAIIGPSNRLQRSIVCREELVLLEDVTVQNCVDCEGPVFIKGARVGVGGEGGGVTSAGTIYLEKAEGAQKIYSREEIRTVESIKDVTAEELNKIIEREGP